MTIRVLHVLGSLRPSGMEKMLLTADAHFRAEGIENIILGQGDHHPFENDLRAAGHDVRLLKPVGNSVRNAKDLRTLLHELNVDVIHIHTEGNYLLTTLACRWALGRRGAIVRTIHSIFAANGIWRIRRFLQAVVADRFVGALIAPSPDVASVEKSILRRPKVIFNWVDDAFFTIAAQRKSRRGGQSLTPLAVIVGNCSEIKNHELALESLSASGHNLIHVGDETGASKKELALLQSLDDTGRLLGRGVQPPQSALLRADYFMMPSHLEGMGVALAEALVAGVPALVMDVPGLQWAKGIRGVSMLPEQPSTWGRAAEALVADEPGGGAALPDFRAARGARDYAVLYSKVSNRGKSAFRREKVGK